MQASLKHTETVSKSLRKTTNRKHAGNGAALIIQQTDKIIFKLMATNGYKTKDFGVPVKRYCQTLRLKDDAELIRKYREAHDREHFWNEIKQGIKSVGILEMEIYILDNTLFMIVDAPLDFDWDEAMARLACLPRQQEWEEHVARFQECAPSSTSSEKWKMMERMFYLYDD